MDAATIISKAQQSSLLNQFQAQQNMSFKILFDISTKYNHQGNETESLKFLERALIIQKDIDPTNLQEVAQDYANRCNRIAMKSLQENNYEQCFEYLQKAELMCNENSSYIRPESLKNQLRATILNNYGCYYRRRGQLKKALKAFDSALQIEQKINNYELSNPAATLMNLSVILSQLDQHNQALNYAQSAVNLILEHENQRTMRDMLAVAYHNLAVEYEFLGQYENSGKFYHRAVSIAQKDLGENHPTTLSLAHSLQRAIQKMERMGIQVKVNHDKFIVKMPPIKGSLPSTSKSSTLDSARSRTSETSNTNSNMVPKPPPPTKGTNNVRRFAGNRGYSSAPPVYIRKSRKLATGTQSTSLPITPPSEEHRPEVISVIVPKDRNPPKKMLYSPDNHYHHYAQIIQRVYRRYLERKYRRITRATSLSYKLCSEDFLSLLSSSLSLKRSQNLEYESDGNLDTEEEDYESEEEQEGSNGDPQVLLQQMGESLRHLSNLLEKESGTNNKSNNDTQHPTLTNN